MTHCHASPGQTGKGVLRKHLSYQPQVLAGGKNAVIVDHNAAAFLPPVLEGIKPVIDQLCCVRGVRTDYTKHTAFLMNRHIVPRKIF
jgi:hypothetical protein